MDIRAIESMNMINGNGASGVVVPPSEVEGSWETVTVVGSVKVVTGSLVGGSVVVVSVDVGISDVVVNGSVVVGLVGNLIYLDYEVM
ncbi:MAG: hypothetical protein ACXAD7_02600 [Candidatus Kariarchaeaceae archaeon]|jgi:hypothetical protein